MAGKAGTPPRPFDRKRNRPPEPAPVNRIKAGLSQATLAKLDAELARPMPQPEPPLAPPAAPPPRPPPDPSVLDLQAIEAELCKRDLYKYLKAAWSLIEPGRAFIDGWHTRAICEHLMALSAGQIQRLIICVPPGSGKSSTASVAWPTWQMARDPTWRVIGASHSEGLAVRDCMRHRRIVTSDWYQQSFVGGDWTITGERQDLIETSEGGRRQAIGTGSGVTGFRCDTAILDDCLPAQASYSKALRESAWTWFGTVLASRLDPLEAKMLAIGQRLAVDDLPGRLLADDPGKWELLMLPSEFEHKRSRTTVLGFKDPRTEEGEPLWPAMFSREVLAQCRKDMGSSVFAGQHQQNPVDQTGGVFKAEHFRFHHPDGQQNRLAARPSGCWDGPSVPLPNLDRVVVSVDATFKSSKDSDYVAMLAVGQAGALWFVLGCLRRRMSFTETLAALRSFVSAYPTCRRVLIEQAANGEAILDVLHREVPGLVGVRATESKEARASSVSPIVEALQVHLPDGATWVDDFVTEMVSFPRGAHDDMVDAFSQALRDVPAFVGALNLERGAFALPKPPDEPRDEWGRPLKPRLQVVR